MKPVQQHPFRTGFMDNTSLKNASCLPTAATFDYTRMEPCVIRETEQWAVVYKPPHLPTAPLRADERNTLVYWFLHHAMAASPMQQAPADTEQPILHTWQQVTDIQPIAHYMSAAQVRGKKAIEAGLLHRLDTETRGLVLFAKNQVAYDFLAAQQEAGCIVKAYCAFAAVECSAVEENISIPLPKRIISQFRNFGPGAKKVAPVFPDSRHYTKTGRLYTTEVTAIEMLMPFHGGMPVCTEKNTEGSGMAIGSEHTGTASPVLRVQCGLSRGYRHQVRAHLAAIGLPITGDALYAPHGMECTRLQLYAVSLSFPDPENPHKRICVALPLPDKMNP